MIMFSLKRKPFRSAGHLTISLLLCLALVCTPLFAGAASEAYAASSECLELEGTNIGANDYYFGRYGRPVFSYLTASGSGYMRVQGYGSRYGYSYPVDDGSFDAVYYDENFDVTSHKHIEAELPLFGAFYETDSNYYIVSGQDNPEEDPNLEVFRITKYDKKWNRISSCGLKGANTTVPFDAGSCRIDDGGGKLIIRTSHEMYKSYDGLNHQASVLMVVDTDAMKITQAQYDVGGTSYVSHSFNQFVKVDDGVTAMLDHGDGYPRCLVLMRYANDLSAGTLWGMSISTNSVMSFPGGIGENETGATVGGFESSSNGYLVAGSAIYQNTSELDLNKPYDVFLVPVTVSDETISSGSPIWLTDVGSSGSASTPQLVKINDNKFMVLWSHSGKVHYTLVDGSGNQLTETYSMSGDLSDCQPIVRDGSVIWYTWNDGDDYFYTIPVASPDKAQVAEKRSGHDWQTVSASDGVANLKCRRCGATKAVSYPTQFMLGYSTDKSSYSYGYRKAEVSLSDTVYLRGGYRTDDNEFIAFDELTLEADSANVIINSKANTLTFADEGKYTVTGHYRFDPDTYAEMTFIVEDPAHIWEVDKAQNSTITYKCSHCGKTKTGTYPTEFRLGYSPDGYSYSYGHDQTSVDVGGTLYFNAMYYDEDGYSVALSDIVLETDDPENAAVTADNSVRFSTEGSYKVTARYKYDPSVSSSLTVHALGSDHVWEFKSAEEGLATFVCKDCGITKTEEYPMHVLVGFRKGSDPGSCAYSYGQGLEIIDISETVYLSVYGWDNMDDFIIESNRPDDCVIDNKNHSIKFTSTGFHELNVHYKYDSSASGEQWFIVNKDLESVELVAEPANNCAVGSEVTLDAEEDGGWGYEIFTYTVTDPSGNTSELYVGNMHDGDSRSCKWTPDQTGTYKIHVSVYDTTKPDVVVEDDMTYIVSAKAHESMPAAEYSIPYSSDSFGNELLADAEGWEFDAKELAAKGHSLEVGAPVTITARYTADDQSDYDFNEVTITVTRSACDHSKTIVEGAKEATCAEEGATGDTICTICGELVKASVAIPVDTSRHVSIHNHEAVPATQSEDGMTASSECTACGTVIEHSEVIPAIGLISVSEPENNKYTGKAKAAIIEITDRTGTLLTKGTDYLVSYEDNVKPGTALVNIEFTGKYEGEYFDSFTIVKGDNPMTVKGKTATVKYSKLRKASQKVTAVKAMTIYKRQGKASYKLTSVTKSKYKKYFKVSSSTGAITVKKGLKKGTYKLKIKVTAAGNTNYRSISKTATVTIKVK